jgi:simple sugar transport system permease protein
MVTVAGVIVMAGALRLFGFDPATALGALWRGSFGSWYAITSATLPRSVPLILIGLGTTFAFRGGALNIGAEGQFYAGAIAATAAGVHLASVAPALAIPTICLVSVVAGMIWVLPAIVLKVRYGVLEVISTLLLNFVAEALVSLMVQGPLQEVKRTYPQSDPIAVSARLPMLPGTRIHLGFGIALVLAAGLWILLTRTLWGLQLRALGAGPRAAQVSGRVSAPRMTAAALLVSGALAGLAGGVEVSGVSYALFQNLSPGYGFTGIAVALLARLHPLAVIATGILFAALEAGSGAMQREAGVPAVAVYVVEAAIIVIVLAGESYTRRQRATVLRMDEAM